MIPVPNWRPYAVLWLAIFWVSVGLFVSMWLNPPLVGNQNRSGIYLGSQRWRKQITVTGDVLIIGRLLIEPGTKVVIAPYDDRRRVLLPRRLYPDNQFKRYAKEHSEIKIWGPLMAEGEANNPIIFGSASYNPLPDDWQSVTFIGKGSRLSYLIVSYSRMGLLWQGRQEPTKGPGIHINTNSFDPLEI